LKIPAHKTIFNAPLSEAYCAKPTLLPQPDFYLTDCNSLVAGKQRQSALTTVQYIITQSANGTIHFNIIPYFFNLATKHSQTPFPANFLFPHARCTHYHHKRYTALSFKTIPDKKPKYCFRYNKLD
jgi:hypothetical protein